MKKLFDLRRVALERGAQEAVAAAATLTAAVVDALNFRHAIFYVDIVATGVVGYTISLEQSLDNSTWAAVPSAKFEDIVGSITDEVGTEVFEVTPKSLQRYLRAKIVTTGAGTSTMAVVYAMGDKDYTPTQTEFLDN